MTEEIALKLLTLSNYNFEAALAKLKSREASYEVVRLINTMNQHDSRIELIGFILKLQE